jgi:hypothetical protein
MNLTRLKEKFINYFFDIEDVEDRQMLEYYKKGLYILIPAIVINIIVFIIIK